MNKKDSTVLALKYRPQSWDNIIGQNIIVETIKNSIKFSKTPNAWLITGIRGSGKTTIARLISKSLNCVNGIENLCKDKFCEQCNSIINSNSIDCLEMDAASKTGVDDVRDLIEFSKYGPTSAKYKIFIIDEAHQLSKQAFAALLKTLEEPPAYLKFILCSTEIHKFPVTIVSRCQKYNLSRVKNLELLNFLNKITKKEDGNISEEALKLITKISEGSVRDSLSLLDRALITQKISNKKMDLNLAQKVFGYFEKSNLIDLLIAVLKGEEKEAINLYRNISDQGVEPSVFMNEFIENLYLIKNLKVFGSNEIIMYSLNENELTKIEEISKKIKNETLIMFWQFAIQLLDELKIVSNQNLSVEMFLIRLIHLKEMPNLEDLVNKISDIDNYENIKMSNKNQLTTIQFENDEDKNLTKSHSQIKNFVQEKKEEVSKTDQSINSSFISIDSFDDLINLCSKKKELKLKFELERNVSLLKFEKKRINISFNEKLDKDFIKHLSNKLYDWTGERWMITLSQLKGEPTKLNAKLNLEKENLEIFKKKKLYKEILQIFPDAKLVKVEEQNE